MIVPDVTHDPEIAALYGEENGLFYNGGDVEDLINKICTIIDDPVYREKLSAKALETVEENYSMDKMVSRYVAAILAASK